MVCDEHTSMICIVPGGKPIHACFTTNVARVNWYGGIPCVISTTCTPGMYEYNFPFTLPAKKSLYPQSVVKVTIVEPIDYMFITKKTIGNNTSVYLCKDTK